MRQTFPADFGMRRGRTDALRPRPVRNFRRDANGAGNAFAVYPDVGPGRADAAQLPGALNLRRFASDMRKAKSSGLGVRCGRANAKRPVVVRNFRGRARRGVRLRRNALRAGGRLRQLGAFPPVGNKVASVRMVEVVVGFKFPNQVEGFQTKLPPVDGRVAGVAVPPLVAVGAGPDERKQFAVPVPGRVVGAVRPDASGIAHQQVGFRPEPLAETIPFHRVRHRRGRRDLRPRRGRQRSDGDNRQRRQQNHGGQSRGDAGKFHFPPPPPPRDSEAGHDSFFSLRQMRVSVSNSLPPDSGQL